MPPVEVVIFADANGTAPLLEWLDEQPQKAKIKCIAFVQLLAEQGYELTRPHCDYLSDEIYELKIGRQGINYRVL